MQRVNTATGAILFQLQPLGVIPSVFAGCIGSFLALGAGKVNNSSCFRFSSHDLLYNLGNGAGTYCPTSLADGKA